MDSMACMNPSNCFCMRDMFSAMASTEDVSSDVLSVVDLEPRVDFDLVDRDAESECDAIVELSGDRCLLDFGCF